MPAKPKKKPVAALRNRIVAHDLVPAETLEAHPSNFRRHPAAQRAALEGSLTEIGWVKAVLVNRTTGRIIDGHARVEEAARKKEPVPVDYVELSEEEERLALATLDPLTEMATVDDQALAALLQGVETEDAGLRELLASLEPEQGGDEPVTVEEVDVSAVTEDRFWMSVRGPLPEQMEAIERLRALLEELPGVEVEVGTFVG
jgi:hypothetical protein